MVEFQTPIWMRRGLLLAVLHNFAWGMVLVVAPGWSSQLLGFDPPPRYLELWQAIGMIVAVFGVGYWIASRNPLRHWAIVFVGLLAKVLGPIGLLWPCWQGTLPHKMIVATLINDVIWWIPFGMILWHAAKELSTVVRVPGPLRPSESLKDQNGLTVHDHSRSGRFLLVFLRHSGCTFCREAIADIASKRNEFTAAGISVGFVHMGEANSTVRFEASDALDFPRFSDPDRQLYAEFELGLGSIGQLFGPATFLRGLKAAVLDRHGFGTLEGNGLQMPGVFLLRNGEILSSYHHTTAADRPDYLGICELA